MRASTAWAPTRRYSIPIGHMPSFTIHEFSQVSSSTTSRHRIARVVPARATRRLGLRVGDVRAVLPHDVGDDPVTDGIAMEVPEGPGPLPAQQIAGAGGFGLARRADPKRLPALMICASCAKQWVCRDQ